MSEFIVPVCRLEEIAPHPNADRLDIGRVGGYRFIIGRGEHTVGELGAYIPEGSVLPEDLIEAMGLTGKLAGKQKNRVKAIRLRGELSQGLWHPLSDFYEQGEDVSASFGITKYEPPIPLQLQGKVKEVVFGPERHFWHDYDLENIKRFPDAFAAGEWVSITEKLHGTLLFCGIINGELIVSSKGLAKRRLAIEEDASNLYWRAVRSYHLEEKLREWLGGSNGSGDIILFAEVLGPQDLKYDLAPGQIALRAFDLFDKDGFYPYFSFYSFCAVMEIPMVPCLYEGEFSPQIVAELTSGKSTIASHMREGVVVKAVEERADPRFGRAALKSVSPEYLLRGGDTTEYA